MSMQMKVYRADTGEVYELCRCSPTSTVLSVKEELAARTSIDVKDQMLLCEKYQLDDSRTLEAYGLPTDDRAVFLISRQSILPGGSPPKETVLPSVELRVPADPPAPHGSGVVGTLQTYQHQFRSHLNVAKAVLEAFDTRLAVCRRCCAEQDVQVQALDVVIAYVRERGLAMTEGWRRISKSVRATLDKAARLFESLDIDIAQLRTIDLPPPLQVEGRRTLADVVSEANLREWAKTTRAAAEQLRAGAPSYEQKVASLQQESERTLPQFPPHVNLMRLKEDLESVDSMRQEVASAKASFSQALKKVTAAIESLARHPTQNARELYDLFDSIKTAHMKQLDRLIKINNASSEAMKRCAEHKTRLSVAVHAQMQRMVELEGRVMSTVSDLTSLKNALHAFDRDLSQLGYVQSLPQTCKAMYEEAVQRRACAKHLRALFLQFLQGVTKICEADFKRREVFITQYGAKSPSNLIPDMRLPLPDVLSPLKELMLVLDRYMSHVEAPDVQQGSGLFSGGELLSQPSRVSTPPANLVSANKSSSSMELSGRFAALEAENARLVAENRSLRHDRDMRGRELERREQQLQDALNRNEELQKKGRSKGPDESPLAAVPGSGHPPAVISPGSSGGDSSVMSASSSGSESSYQQRIQKLEKKLSETYGLASLAEQGREAAEKRAAALEAELRRLRERLAAAAGAEATSGGSADVAAAKALRAECNELRDRLGKLSEENRLLSNTLREAQSALMERSQQQYGDAADREAVQLRECMRELERCKIELDKTQATLAQEEAIRREVERKLEQLETEKQAQARAAKKAMLNVIAEYDKAKSSLTSAGDLSSSALLSEGAPSTSSSGRVVAPRRERNRSLLGADGRAISYPLLEEANRAAQLAEEQQASMAKSVHQLEARTRQLLDLTNTTTTTTSAGDNKQREKELEEEKEALQKDLEEARNRVQEKELEIARLREAQAQSEEESRQRKEEVEQLQRLLEEERSNSEALQQQSANLIAEMEETRKRDMSSSAEGDATLARLHVEIEMKEHKIAQLTEASAEQAQRLAELEERLDTANNDLIFAKKELKQKRKELDDLRNMERTMALLREEADQKEKHSKEQIAELTAAVQHRLALSDFKVDDLVCFQYNSNGFYEALNENAPRYFLAEESLTLFRDYRRRREHIIGRVVFVQPETASAEENPYRLPIGTAYHNVMIIKNEAKAEEQQPTAAE